MRCVDIGPNPLSDCVFHSSKNFFAICSVEGTLDVFECDRDKFLTDQNPLLPKIQYKDTRSSRTLRFNNENTIAFSNNSGDVKAFDFVAGKVSFDGSCRGRSHGTSDSEQCAVNSLLWWNNEILVSGCENGSLRFWDLRLSEPLVASIEECDDQITAIDQNNDEYTLYVGSGDQLSVFDLRKTGRQRLLAMSDGLGAYITSLCVVNSNKRVWCGMEDGCIGEFIAGDYGYLKSRIYAENKSDTIECMCKVADTYVICGTTDGLMHVASIDTASIIRTIGVPNICQEDERGSPLNSIDILSINSDKSILAASQIGDTNVFFHDVKDVIVEEDAAQAAIDASGDFYQDL